jgi:hypothetical protein
MEAGTALSFFKLSCKIQNRGTRQEAFSLSHHFLSRKTAEPPQVGPHRPTPFRFGNREGRRGLSFPPQQVEVVVRASTQKHKTETTTPAPPRLTPSLNRPSASPPISPPASLPARPPPRSIRPHLGLPRRRWRQAPGGRRRGPSTGTARPAPAAPVRGPSRSLRVHAARPRPQRGRGPPPTAEAAQVSTPPAKRSVNALLSPLFPVSKVGTEGVVLGFRCPLLSVSRCTESIRVEMKRVLLQR